LQLDALSSFEQDRLTMHVVDPGELEPEPIDCPIDADQFFWSYYQPLVRLKGNSALARNGSNAESIGTYRYARCRS